MKIKQLQLQNYGRFEDLMIDFAPTEERASNVTVIVGNNGAGKSQILQALATGLSWFVNGLINEQDGESISENLIKNGKNESKITIDFDFDEYDYRNQAGLLEITRWEVIKTKDGKVGSFHNYLKEIKRVIKNFRYEFTKNSEISLPIIVFYSVERSTLTQFISLDSNLNNTQLKGYDYAFHNGIDFSSFLNWFKNMEDIENASIGSTIRENKYEEFGKLSSKIERIQKSMTKLNFDIQSESDINARIKLIDEQSDNFEKLGNLVEELQSIKFQLGIQEIIQKHKNTKLNSVRNAILDFTDFMNIHIERQGTPTMIVEKDGEELDVNQLSQGEKSLLALVGDIARRLAILNPSLDDPLQGEGVVMIDEVDLHLHPKWQHDLIDKLVRTFPNVQFILTTHSPLIVSDRADILVYLLDDGNIRSMDNIYGEDANTLLNDIFYVPPRTPEVEETFNAIRRAISNKELESAESQINNIAKKVSSSNTELLKVRLMLAQAKLAQNKVS